MQQELMSKYYPGGAPIIIQVAFKYGYGPAIVELNKKVYFNKNISCSPLIREAIQAVCLSNCENDYCTVMHTRGLSALGLTLDDVKALIEFQRLPTAVEGREIWEPSLRTITTIFREPQLAARLYSGLTKYHDERQLEDIGGIIAFSLLHKFLLEFYSDEIDITQEPILFKTIDCADELIAYFNKNSAKDLPLYSMCCICKDVRGKHGWIPIETALREIPAEATFSHGFCESCVEREYPS